MKHYRAKTMSIWLGRMKMIKIFFTQEEINQLYQVLDNIPSEIYSECDTPDDLDKELLSGIKKLKKETKDEY